MPLSYYKCNQEKLEAVRVDVNERADQYGRLKLDVASNSIGRTVRLLEELQRRGKIGSFQILTGIEVSREGIKEFDSLAVEATEILGSLTVGAVKGAMSASAVYALAGSVGYASTGTAIGTLAGAAAKSATLAWLGGGSLAVGGFGMAGGMAVLGGLVTAPVFLIGGFTLASKGAEALKKAHAYAAQVKEEVEKMDLAKAMLRQVAQRLEELSALVYSLRQVLDRAVQWIWSKIHTFSLGVASNVAELALVMNITKALSDVIRTPVLRAEDGAVNPELPGLVARYRMFLP
jgi:hypothetical protein